MIRIEASVEIERSAADVFAFISDFENNPRWQSGMVEARWTSESPLRADSTYDQRARFLGRDVITSFRVAEYEPGRRVTIESTGGSFPIRVTRTVTGDGDRATARAVVEGDPSGFFRLAGPLPAALVRRSVRKDYRSLKRLLEEEGRR